MRVGIDIGGMSIKIGLVDKNNQIVAKKQIQTEIDKTYQVVIEGVVNAVFELLEETGHNISTVERIGIACAGTIDAQKGMVLYSNNIGWEDVPIVELMQENILKRTTKLPEIAIANDADAAALAEVKCGAAKGVNNAVLITLGTGVGGGAVIDGRLFKGATIGGFEPGHIVIRQNGTKCTCGRRGCLEMYASARALMNMAGENISGKEIFDRAKAGEDTYVKIVDEYMSNLACGLINITNVLRPEKIIIGGGVSEQGEYLTKPLEEMVAKEVFGGEKTYSPKIITSAIKNDAGIIGAANL